MNQTWKKIELLEEVSVELKKDKKEEYSQVALDF